MPPRKLGIVPAALLGLLAACGESVPPFLPMTMPSGRIVKVQSFLPTSLFTGEEALLLKFVPDASIDDATALDAEVSSLWKEVLPYAEQQPGTKLVLLRAISPEPAGWSDGRQSQYVFRLQPDGSWSMQKDPELRLH